MQMARGQMQMAKTITISSVFTELLSFYAPNFEEVECAYWFKPVRPSVGLSVTPFLVVKLENRLN